jgi:hypothetical protein
VDPRANPVPIAASVAGVISLGGRPSDVDACQVAAFLIVVAILVGVLWYAFECIRRRTAFGTLPWMRRVAKRCERCHYDLAPRVELCTHCGQPTPHAHSQWLAALRDRWPATPINIRVTGPDESPTIVFGSPDWALIDLLCLQLQARGIAAFATPPQSFAYHRVGDAKLAVWSGDVELARELLAKLWPGFNPSCAVNANAEVVPLDYAGPRPGPR